MNLQEMERVFRAFSDGTRIRVMNLLSRGELCVCDVMAVLKEPQSKVSRHFAYLRRAGLVTGRKEGLWMYYRLSGQGNRVFRPLMRAFCGDTSRVDELCRDRNALNQKKKRRLVCCT